MRPIAINTRSVGARMNGVLRYTTELLARWNGHAERIAPEDSLAGIGGHAWEQLVLPQKLGRRLLFSPSNTGPLKSRNQVVTIHDMSPFDCGEGFNPTFAAWYRFLLPRLARRARRVITDSEFVKTRIVTHTKVSPEKITVIYCGADSRFRPEAITHADETIRSLRLPSRHYVLAVGSVEPRKNLRRLFQAWERIHRRISEDIILVVAGHGGNSRVFSSVDLGALPPRVFLTGHVDDQCLPALYAGALALVYPSIYEGFGLPALEAMASGIPVLAGNCSSLPEVVADAGLLVDPLDVEALGEGICRLVEDSEVRHAYREKGLLRAKQFSWDETARRTWDVLQTAAEDN